MSIYRLYCGRNIPRSNQTVSEKDIRNFLNNQPFFEGFTHFQAFGMWKGEMEKTLIIEVITDDRQKVISLAQMYKDMFFQESVLVTKSDDKADFI